jgi:hypothetical protein
MMDMKKIFLAIIVLMTLIASAAAGSPNLIQNGGFEAPGNVNNWDTFLDGTPGLAWHVTDGIGIYNQDFPGLEIQTFSTLQLTPYEGSQYAELDSWGNVNISQVIPTENGAVYQISYEQNCRDGDPHLPSIVGVSLDGANILTTSCTKQSAWTLHTADFTGTGQAVTLMFADLGTSDQYGVLLDDVRVEKTEGSTPAPEFPSAFLPVTLIFGFLGTVLLIKRTRE